MFAYRWSLCRMTCDNFSHFPQTGGGGAEKLSRFRKSYVKRTISNFLPANLSRSAWTLFVSLVWPETLIAAVSLSSPIVLFSTSAGRWIDRRILSDYVVRHGRLKLLAFRFNLPKTVNAIATCCYGRLACGVAAHRQIVDFRLDVCALGSFSDLRA